MTTRRPAAAATAAGATLPPVMTLEQAAERLSLTPADLVGGPRTLNVLGTVLVLRDDLREWLAAR